jgi:hypothetical protein
MITANETLRSFFGEAESAVMLATIVAAQSSPPCMRRATGY